jgi:hypothetical protein
MGDIISSKKHYILTDGRGATAVPERRGTAKAFGGLSEALVAHVSGAVAAGLLLRPLGHHGLGGDHQRAD